MGQGRRRCGTSRLPTSVNYSVAEGCCAGHRTASCRAYLDVGGGAAAASSYSASALFRDISAASTSLPTALPPRMVLLGRAVLQLEGLALRGDPAYRLVDDILPVAARIALSSDEGIDRLDDATRADDRSLLVELLYDEADGGPRFSPERLQRVLETASSPSSSAAAAARRAPADAAANSSTTALLDVLLASEGARGLVAQEAAGAIDALARDALWKSAARLAELPLPRVPGVSAASALAERLTPRLSTSEEMLLVALPTALAGVVAPTAPNRAGDGSTVEPLPAGLSDFAVIRVAAEPAARAALLEVARRAVLEADEPARATVDNVADALRTRLRGRLREAELPEGIADAVVRTPW